MHTFTRVLFLSGLLALLLGGVGACAPIVTMSGNKPDQEQMSELKPGHHDRDDVAEIMGSPSSITSFKPETWYYISKRTERIAFLAPTLKESEVVALVFNERGILQEIKTIGMEARRDIAPVERITPTTGTEMGVIEQLMGNFGRFNNADSAPAGAPGG